MDPATIQRLIQRVYRLEQEVERLRAKVDPEGDSVPLPDIPAPVPGRAAVQVPAAFTAARPAARPTPVDDRAEAALIGSWFARVGALAILIGAGFGFAYAVDRGYIGPSMRVSIGMLAGLGFIGWGAWAYRKGWALFAQAVTGGGLALMYLSTLAASQLYGLIGDGPAFVVLIVIAVAGGLLALAYDASALATLAAIGGYLNPFLVATRSDADSAAGVLLYLVALNAMLLAAASRRWRALDGVALAGTVVVFAVAHDGVAPLTAVAYAGVLLAMFVVLPLVRRLSSERPITSDDVPVPVLATVIAVLYVLSRLQEGYAAWDGLMMAGLAVFFAGLTGLSKQRANDGVLTGLFLGLATAAAVGAVPVQFEGPPVAIAWSVQGLAVVWLASRANSARANAWGAGIVGLGVLASIAVMSDGFPPDRLVVTTGSAAVLLSVACVGLASALRARGGDARASHDAVVGAVVANVLVVLWASVEVTGHVTRTVADLSARAQGVAFSLSALWAVYAAVLLVVGVKARIRWARHLAVVGFGIVVAKMAVSDLWFLPTSYRVIAFLGLGVVLLACSVMYQRFRDLIAEDAADAEAR